MLKYSAAISALVVPFLFFPSQAQAIVGLQSITGGTLFPSFNSTNMTIGWSFTANNNLSVSSLGLFDETTGTPLSQNHQVGLWTSTGTLLSSVTVRTNSALTGSFRYESITPVSLTSGSTYFLGSTVSSPFDDRYLSGATSITTAPQITFGNTLRNASAGGFSFPSTTGPGNGRFGPNFQFDVLVPPSVPEPDSTLGFLAIGIFGIASTLKGRVKS